MTSHELSAETRVAYENITRGLPETVLISAPGGAWLVPRIFHRFPASRNSTGSRKGAPE